MADFAAKITAAARKVRCGMCEEKTEAFRCIQCSECDANFCKTCVQPLRTEWPDDEKFLCEDCSEHCVLCASDDDDDDVLIQCDECEDWFHLSCLDEEDQPPAEEIGDDEKEWMCPECREEYGSDNEWAKDHIVQEEDMQRDDCFSRSKCECNFCVDVHRAVDTWADFQPRNSIEAGMKQAIDAKEGLVNTVMDNLHFRHGMPSIE